jgi:uncharacterized membrane protein
MTSSGEDQQGEQQQGGLLSTLGDAAKGYAVARGQDAAKKVGDKLSGVTGSLNDTAEGGGFKATAAGEAVRRAVSGESPVKAALGGIGSGIKEKVSGLFGRKKSGGSGNKKFMNIIEDITVGVPVNVAYDQWTQFQEFASFMKGVESVDQTDELNSNWRVKVAKSRRNFKATVTEQIPDRKIAWTTEGAKGTVKGVVTFHPLAAQGRRTRLDLKHFRRFIMQRGEATGSWRGEIRDGEVVRGPEDEESEEQQPEAAAEEQPEEESSEEPSEDEDEAEYEDEYADEDEEPESEDEEADQEAEEAEREPEPAGAR